MIRGENHRPTGRPGTSPQSHRLVVATGKPQIPREEQPVAVMARRSSELRIAHTEAKPHQPPKEGHRITRCEQSQPGWVLGGRKVTRIKPVDAWDESMASRTRDMPCEKAQFSGKPPGDSQPCPHRKRSMRQSSSLLHPDQGQGSLRDQGLLSGPVRLARQVEGEPEPEGQTEGVISESSGVLTDRSGRDETAVPRGGPCVQGVNAQVARSIQNLGSDIDHIDGGGGHTISNRRLRAGVLAIETVGG